MRRWPTSAIFTYCSTRWKQLAMTVVKWYYCCSLNRWRLLRWAERTVLHIIWWEDEELFMVMNKTSFFMYWEDFEIRSNVFILKCQNKQQCFLYRHNNAVDVLWKYFSSANFSVSVFGILFHALDFAFQFASLLVSNFQFSPLEYLKFVNPVFFNFHQL